MRLTLFPEWFAIRNDATEILSKVYHAPGGFSPNIFRDTWVAYFEGPDIPSRLMGFLGQHDLFEYYSRFVPSRNNLKWLYNTEQNKYFEVEYIFSLKEL